MVLSAWVPHVGVGRPFNRDFYLVDESSFLISKIDWCSRGPKDLLSKRVVKFFFVPVNKTPSVPTLPRRTGPLKFFRIGSKCASSPYTKASAADYVVQGQ